MTSRRSGWIGSYPPGSGVHKFKICLNFRNNHPPTGRMHLGLLSFCRLLISALLSLVVWKNCLFLNIIMSLAFVNIYPIKPIERLSPKMIIKSFVDALTWKLYAQGICLLKFLSTSVMSFSALKFAIVHVVVHVAVHILRLL